MRRKFIVLTLCLILTGLNVNAATVTAQAETPTVGAFDIAQLLNGNLETENVGPDGDDEWTYVSNDRETQGQVFTLTSGAKVMGLWVRHVNYGTWNVFDVGATATVRISSVSGTTLTVLRSETATIAAGQAKLTNNPWESSNKWIHIALATPVLLPGAGTYAFDLTSISGGFCVEIAGVKTNPYSGGNAYTTADGQRLALEMARPYVNGDRTFILNLTPSKVNPVAPAPGAVNVDVNQDLSWTVSDAAVTKVDLYFGTVNDPNLSLIPGNKKLSMAPVATTTWDTALLPAGKLEYNTTYYWKVDAYEPNGVGYNKTQGDVWSFTTVGQTAVPGAVTPALTAVDAGATVVLNLTGTANATIYRWYKDGGALSDSADFSGTATASLTINDVQLADEGSYYCQVDNDLPNTDPVNSAAGLVMTKRLIIHYPLDAVDGTSTLDVVGGHNMTLMSDDGGADLPSLTAGVPQLGGNALLFDNRGAADPNFWGQYATAGDVDMEAMGNGLTIAFWAYWIDDNTNWQGIINRRNYWDGANMMWRIDKNPSTGAISFGRAGGSGEVATTLVKGGWHQITATFDAVSGATKIYNNGELAATGSGFTYGTGANSGFKLGCNNDDGSDFFNGKIDDVKVYNYARSTVQIAQDYANVMGGYVCDKEGTDALLYDINKDCQVDIGDLLLLAADWLNSNRINPQP
jgi:hypothetical protein